MPRSNYVIPPLNSRGGDWWYGAMERLWFLIAHLEMKKAWDAYHAGLDEAGYDALDLDLTRIQPFGLGPIATGGNEPKRVLLRPWYIKETS